MGTKAKEKVDSAWFKSIAIARRTVPLLFCFLLAACTPAITKTEYDKKCKETVNLHATITGQVYYQGSKGGYEYFLFEPNGVISHHARVKEGEVALKKRIPFTEDKSQWTVTFPNLSLADITNIVIQTGGT